MAREKGCRTGHKGKDSAWPKYAPSSTTPPYRFVPSGKIETISPDIHGFEGQVKCLGHASAQRRAIKTHAL